MVGTYQVIIDSTPSLKMRYLAAGRVGFHSRLRRLGFSYRLDMHNQLDLAAGIRQNAATQMGLRGGLLGEAQTYRDRDLLG